MVNFWRDRGCGITLLCDSFPSLFALAPTKEAWVKVCGLLHDPCCMKGFIACVIFFSRKHLHPIF